MSEAFDLHWDRGWEFYEAEKFEEAISEWRLVGEIDPEDGYVNNNIGRALSKLGREEEAIAEWRKAVQLEPDYDAPHTNLAYALSDPGYSPEALAAVRAAIRLKSDNVYLYNYFGFHLLVQANQRNDKAGWEAAGATFQQAIDIEPTNSYAHRHLAKTQWFLGKKREAIATLEAAISVNPEDFKAHKQLLGYQTWTGNLRGAIRTGDAIYALPETEETDQYVADSDRLEKRVITGFYVSAGLAAVLVGVSIWNRRRGR